MGTVTALELRDLVTHQDGWCVSIYLPMHAAGLDGQQDAVRLKNLAAAAELQLIEKGMRTVAARELLAFLQQLPFDMVTWERRQQGLAVFRSMAVLRPYWLSITPRESIVVDRRFHVKQLLPAIDGNPRFMVLALSRNQVRLLDATLHEFQLVRVPEMPTNIVEALNLQGADRGEQVHTGMRGDLGKEAAVFHGQGGHRDTLKDEIVTYLGQIEAALRPALRNRRDPLILAGVEYEVAMFRSICTYPYVADRALHGGFDYLKDHQLFEQALPIAQQVIAARQDQLIAKYRAAENMTKASDDLQRILPAAHQGRIETLLVDHRDTVFGRLGVDDKSVEIVNEPDPALDLIESAIAQTIMHGGDVYSATRDELPTPGPLRAIFRY